MPYPGRGGQWSHQSRCRHHSLGASRDFHHPRHSLQCGRGDRVVLRMGPGFAKFFLERNRGDRQIVPHPRNRVHPNAGHEPKTKHLHAPGRAQPRSQTGPGGQINPRALSVKPSESLKQFWLKSGPRQRRLILYLGVLLGFAAWKFTPRYWKPALTIETAHYQIASTATPEQTREMGRMAEILYAAYSRRLGSLPTFQTNHPKLKLLL